jgi:hypothetical protein
MRTADKEHLLLKKWLESRGYLAMITHGKSISFPIWNAFPERSHIIPDVVGVKEGASEHLVIIEKENDIKDIFSAIGKCMLWKTMASVVYLAYPADRRKKLSGLRKLGIGLLNIKQNEVEELIPMLPQESGDLFKSLELHPLDHTKEKELIRMIKELIKHEKT